jgi:UDP-glucuronate 4-epimerase
MFGRHDDQRQNRHMKRFLVTGSAGFIGFHVAKRLLREGKQVTGMDNLNAYYDVNLKRARLEQLIGQPGFRFELADLADRARMEQLFREEPFHCVIHLAAQAGVRYSLSNPHAYIQSNVVGFTNVLECCRHAQVKHLVFASSSSVYGANKQMPFSVRDSVDHPVSLYAATKKTDELMAHVYAHLYELPSTGLRFFTVYGPWGRPDMALFIFTQAILKGRPVDVYNHGRMRRDFTYIDDIVEGIIRVSEKIPEPNPDWDGEIGGPGTSSAPYRIYNIGNSDPVDLEQFITILEQKLRRKAKRRLLPMQPGDVPATFADVADLEHDIGFTPSTPLKEGIGHFVDWYLDYYGPKGRIRTRFGDSLEQVAAETLSAEESNALVAANT